ncbi:hypothetical protein NDU88_005609 [Pleurodeles waltl]|uniref:Uncharacterized protein n=1 Tax=Pleurodeles waltl TaxID=8319 RepID=A0AAV7L355_PLEWA|nr:hypothetical protein NDU88_005609 [Pleurodeles waltl]
MRLLRFISSFRNSRGELRGEFRGECMGELRGEWRGELRGEWRGELCGEVRGETRGEITSATGVGTFLEFSILASEGLQRLKIHQLGAPSMGLTKCHHGILPGGLFGALSVGCLGGLA